MTRSRDVSAVQSNLGVAIPPAAAGKNAVINGGFDIWQRGTSFTSLGNVYTADRWNVYATGAGFTASRQTSWLDGFNYAMRIQRNSGSTVTNSTYLSMAFESADLIRFAGKTVTYSFYARKGADYSPTSSNFGVTLAISQSTDGGLYSAGTNELSKIDTNVVLTTAGARYSFTFDVPSGYKSARIQMYMTGVGTAGANDWMEITGVQWEVGSVATPFSRAGGTIQGELAACQRYYYRATAAQNFSQVSNLGTAGSTTACLVIPTLKVTLRTTPTVVDYSGLALSPDNANSYVTVNSATISVASPDNPQISLGVASGLTQYRPYYAIAPTAGGYLGIGAEL